MAVLLRTSGANQRALREAFGLVMTDYLRDREPAKGLAGVYLLQALLAVEQGEPEQTVDLPYARPTPPSTA